MIDEKKRIYNLRYRALRRGLKISSTKMCICEYNKGLYMVLNRFTHEVLLGRNYTATLEEIENFVDNYGKEYKK